MGGGGRNRVFPVGFYGTLLVGVFALFFGSLLATPESWLRTFVSLPLRAYSILAPAPAQAAEPTADQETRHVSALRAELWRRLRQTVLAGARAPAEDVAYVPCVHRVSHRLGGSGPFGTDRLVLATAAGDVAGCHPMVTAGDRLLGFLHQDHETGEVRVRLLHHRPRPPRFRGFAEGALQILATPLPRRVAARIDLGERGALRCLVEPSRAVEDWPLRCGYVDDPYLASRLRRSGQAVTTWHAPDDPQGALPAGLRIGTLKIWGYPARDIPIGLYVEPAQDPQAISAVVLWHRAEGFERNQDAAWGVTGQRHPVRWMRLPSPSGPRWLVTAASGVALRAGAALVEDGMLLGTVEAPWSGQALVLPFGASRRRWSLLLLPGSTSEGSTAPAEPVRELVARVVKGLAQGNLRLATDDPGPEPLPAGALFTGANGPDCPAGLFLGMVRPGHGGTLDLRRAHSQPRTPAVWVGAGREATAREGQR